MPDLTHQLVASDGGSGSSDEVVNEVELLGGERDDGATSPGPPCGGIDTDVLDLEHADQGKFGGPLCAGESGDREGFVARSTRGRVMLD